MKQRCGIVLTACLLASGTPLRADVPLTGNSTLNGGAALVSAPVVANSAGSAPWLYAPGDSLALGAYQLKTDNGEGFTLDMGGHALTGDSGLTSLLTFRSTFPIGPLSIINANGISIGRIDTHTDGVVYQGPTANAGAVAIGQPTGTGSGPIAGPVRVDSIDATKLTGWNNAGNGGSVTIYGSGDVKIQTSLGAAGNVLTHSSEFAGGAVNVQHHGSFAAGIVRTSGNMVGYWGPASSGSATFNGNYGGAGAVGTFQIGGIDTTHPTCYNANAGAISIQGYTGVRIGANGLLANCPTTGGNGGNITVTGITGDIQVDGPSSATSANQTRGTLTLTAGGRITFSNLDLNLLKAAVLSAGGGVYIEGSLLNFPTGDPTNGALDAPTGIIIHYRAKLNPYLGGNTYPLKSGGKLRSEARGSVVFFR